MNKNVVTAAIFALLIVAWLGSGLLQEPATPVPDVQASLQDKPQQTLTTVIVSELQAQPKAGVTILRGKTASKRSANVSAEVAGQVIARPVERGDYVNKGDLLCKIAVNERAAAVEEAKAEVMRAQLEYDGAKRLQGKNLLSESNAALLSAQLAAAQANLVRRELDLNRTRIEAPFAGLVENLPLVLGDYAQIGDTCATVIDLDPILIAANVSERDVMRIRRGDRVTARTSNNQQLTGEVTFIGSQSDAVTRTYPLEITVANPDRSIKAGLTTEVTLAGEATLAHRVSPSLFTLNDAGILGLRTVDDDNTVVFNPVTLIEDTPEGAWITGLPGVARVITVGHEFVAAGQRVDIRTDNTVLDGTIAQ